MRYTISFELIADDADMSQILEAAEQAEPDVLAHLDAVDIVGHLDGSKTTVREAR